MKKPCFLFLLLGLLGCHQQLAVRGGDATAVAGPGGSASASGGRATVFNGSGQSVYAESCSVEAVQTTFSSYVKCTCNGVEIQPVYDNATQTWICRLPTATPAYNHGYPR